jgi:hypothetical protein
MYWVPPSIFMIPRARMIKTRATIRAAVHPAKKPEFFFELMTRFKGKKWISEFSMKFKAYYIYIYIN